jgi:hypothetical protein
MFISRHQRSGPDRFLAFKTGALITGILLGLAGMRVGSSVLVSVAIAVVLLGFLLRFVPDPATRNTEPGDATETPGPRTTDSGPANPP